VKGRLAVGGALWRADPELDARTLTGKRRRKERRKEKNGKSNSNEKDVSSL
jgi:hypothetical protein